MFVRFVMNLTDILMNNSKTYTISADLYKAIIGSVYQKGKVSTYIGTPEYQAREVLKQAIKMVEEQQYIYED